MPKKTISLRFVFLITITILGVIGLGMLLFSNGAKVSWIEIAGFITGALIPAIGFVVQLLEKYSVGFFIFTSRLKSLFVYKVMRWDLSANFAIPAPSRASPAKGLLDGIIMSIRKHPGRKPEDFKIIPLQTLGYEIIVPSGPTLKLKIGNDGDDPETRGGTSVHVTIDNYRVGYNQVYAVISEEIMPVLEDIRNAIHATETNYSLTVLFPKKENPFFGFFVAQLPLDVVTTFNIRLNFAQLSSHVDISMDKLKLNSSSQNAFKDLTVEFLTFSSALGDKLKHV